MSTLSGRRIALLESRLSHEIATLVHRLGGVPITAPAMDEVPCHNDFNVFIDGLAGRRFSLAIFLTGTGTLTLLGEAHRRGRLNEALAALRQTTIACRGAKPLAALKRHGLRAQITTGRPHTSRELMSALATVDVKDRGVVLVHYGERNVEIAESLRSRGARLDEVCPYEWTLPEDLGPITAVVRDAIAHRLDAVLFTSQVQCRHLFQVAAEMGQLEGLALSLNRDIVVGAVGPVCASALKKVGVTPDVIPASPNMPSLITAVADYFELTSTDV
jgi:uroporphyrinogen-III synthase